LRVPGETHHHNKVPIQGERLWVEAYDIREKGSAIKNVTRHHQRIGGQLLSVGSEHSGIWNLFGREKVHGTL